MDFHVYLQEKSLRSIIESRGIQKRIELAALCMLEDISFCLSFLQFYMNYIYEWIALFSTIKIWGVKSNFNKFCIQIPNFIPIKQIPTLLLNARMNWISLCLHYILNQLYWSCDYLNNTAIMPIIPNNADNLQIKITSTKWTFLLLLECFMLYFMKWCKRQ